MVRPERLPRGVSAIAVCAVYIPPDSPHQDLLLDHLIDSTDILRTAYPDIGFVLSGDFNRSKIDTLVKGNGLKQVIKFPTRAQATLDLIITNMDRFYCEPICLPPIGKSDHNCIILKPSNEYVPNKIKMRS